MREFQKDHTKNDQKNDNKNRRAKYLGLMDILILLDHQKMINQHNHLTHSLHYNVIIVGDGATWQRNVLCL